MIYEEALETMCKRCTNHDMCQGTGFEKGLEKVLVRKEGAK